MKLFVLPLAILVLPAAPALASTLDCAGARLAYTYSASDGGAFHQPFETLVLDGATLIQRNTFNPGPSPAPSSARFQLVGTPKVLSATKEGNFDITEFDSAATVTVVGQSQPVFSGTVICRESRYVGPPIP